MSVREIEKTVVVGKLYNCDLCGERTEEEDVAEKLFDDSLHICKECRKKLPDDLIEAAKEPSQIDEKTGKEITNEDYANRNYGIINWRNYAANMFLLSIRESEDTYEWDVGVSDLTIDTWAVFGNGEAEFSEIRKIERGVDGLEAAAKDMEYHYRDFPKYLRGTLVDGKLRHFVTEWKLVEKVEKVEANNG